MHWNETGKEKKATGHQKKAYGPGLHASYGVFFTFYFGPGSWFQAASNAIKLFDRWASSLACRLGALPRLHINTAHHPDEEAEARDVSHGRRWRLPVLILASPAPPVEQKNLERKGWEKRKKERRGTHSLSPLLPSLPLHVCNALGGTRGRESHGCTLPSRAPLALEPTTRDIQYKKRRI